MASYTLIEVKKYCKREIDRQGVSIIENTDGTISVYPDTNNPLKPLILSEPCCNFLNTFDQTNPSVPLTIPKGYYFDLQEQKCRWAPRTGCETQNTPIKIVLNPKGNDGSIFEINGDENCGLKVDFNFLLKLNCETLANAILNASRVSNTTQSQEIVDLKNLIEEQETKVENITKEINSVAQEFVNLKYSIICEDFPFTNDSKPVESTTNDTTIPLSETQKAPFSKTGFGSIAPMSFAAPTRSVIFCLMEPDGLKIWQKILGPDAYKRFIDGDITSYTTKQVVELYNENEILVKENKAPYIIECETPFGYKTQVKKKLDDLILTQNNNNTVLTESKQKLSDLTTDNANTNCGTIIDYFENLSVRMLIEVVEDDNTLTPLTQQQIFPVGNSTTIGSGNLYNYLVAHPLDSGFFVCGQPNSTETWASGCTPIYYTELTNTVQPQNTQTNVNVSSCINVKDALLDALFLQSGYQNSEIDLFYDALSPNILDSNWLHFSDIFDSEAFITGAANQKLKLSLVVNNNCGEFCVLIDQITLQRECQDIRETSVFISQSPGFNLTKVIDNKKSWLNNTEYDYRDFNIKNVFETNPIRQTEYDVNDDRLVINSKEIDLNMNIASAVEYDVWCYLLDNSNLLTGATSNAGNGVLSDCPPPCCLIKQKCGDKNVDFTGFMTTNITEVNAIETFENVIVSELTDAKNRKILSAYPTLRALYDRYINATQLGVPQSNEFTYEKMDNFSNLITTYWDDLIEQVIPATTLWGSVKVYTNTMFDQQKFKYRSYTSLFCSEPEYTFQVPFNVPSPINGNDGLCQNVEVILSYLPNGSSAKIPNSSTYNKICLSQMNYGSEFIGNVDIMGPNGVDINNDDFCMPVPPCPNCVEGAVTIGTQTWDKCNLNVDTYSDGTPIPQVTSPSAWSGLTTGAWCYYDNDPANGAKYGKLYNWYAVAGIYDAASLANPALRKSLAPIGKTIPTDSDWATLITYLGGSQVAGGKLKEEGYCNWLQPNTAATDEYGFTALPGGARFDVDNSPFLFYRSNGYWWTSTQSILSGSALNYNMYSFFAGALQVTNTTKVTGLSVRCLTTPTPPQTLVTCCGEVTIGTQTWDVCNANVETYSDGTPIPQVTDPTEWANLTTGAWCYYNNDPDSEAVYGKLYNWYAAVGIYDAASLANPALRKSLAPVGKSVPTDAQWTTLTTFLGGLTVAGGKLKEEGFCHWLEPNTDATNEYGFTAISGGYRDPSIGSFNFVRVNGFWWSSTENLANPTEAWGRTLSAYNGNVLRSDGIKQTGISVRFINN